MGVSLGLAPCDILQVSEIAFINTLEAQNKKMEVLERHQVSHCPASCQGVNVPNPITLSLNPPPLPPLPLLSLSSLNALRVMKLDCKTFKRRGSDVVRSSKLRKRLLW